MDGTERIGAEAGAERPAAPAPLAERAAAFLDLWERQVSEHARRGPPGATGEDGPAS